MSNLPFCLSVENAVCHFCYIETEEKCKLYHPEWYTKVRKERKMSHLNDCGKWIEQNVERRKCLVEHDEDGFVIWAICPEHGIKVMKEIENAN